MDNSHAGVSDAEKGTGRDLERLSASKKQHNTCSGTEADIVNELGNALQDILQVKDENSETCSNLPSDDDGGSALEDENIAGDSDLNLDGSIAASSKCLHKCATFSVTVDSEERTHDSQLENKACKRSLSFPITSKLVSAMKGSREKEGLPSRKLSVSWAPDVYDPLPTSLSHYPKKKTPQQFKSNKKHGKGKQKGKNTRGGGSGPKDRKHHRKMISRSDRCLDSFADTNRKLSSNNYKSSIELLDFDDVGDDIGSPDPNCGSSFLGQAGGTMHCVC